MDAASLLVASLCMAPWYCHHVAGIQVRQAYSKKVEIMTFDPKRVLENTCCVVRVSTPRRSATACSAACMEIENCMGVYWNKSATNKCFAKRCEMEDEVWRLGSGEGGDVTVNVVEYYELKTVEEANNIVETPACEVEEKTYNNKAYKYPENCHYVNYNGNSIIKLDGMECPAITTCSTSKDGKRRSVVAKKKSNQKYDFKRSWEEYRLGFYSDTVHRRDKAEWWIGLDALHRLTSLNNSTSLEICVNFGDDEKVDPQICYTYTDFQVSGKRDGYRYKYKTTYTTTRNMKEDEVNLKSCLEPSKGTRFSTPDKDFTCTGMAQESGAGWWFNERGRCNPFGSFYCGKKRKGTLENMRFPGILWTNYTQVSIALVEEL